ncbi:sugar ABC transporter permease [uncultured Methylobacterium sp.]|jgi:multiple sugar transport system permease protein|uniref:carbohydrate ABC transporter permease n=1 Tax=uncultured Methylobacterium sp. TaxID=157278 RepID=UPI00262B5E76|nr:sugar ABC transporter permease [uncultured Methylobacterium sp.]
MADAARLAAPAAPPEAAAVPVDRSEERAALVLAGPALLLMLALLVLPTVAVLVLSFTDAELGVPDWHVVGLDAYRDLLADRGFRTSIVNTALYVALVTPVSVGLGLGLALLIEADLPLRSVFRSAYFLPVVSLTVAMATVWQFLLNPVGGPVNALLTALGLPGPNWLGSSDTVLVALALIGIWQTFGFNVVLFLAGLTAINRELYAAAEIDGGRSAFDRFRLVTWPMLGPTTLFVVTITIINAVKVFEPVAALTQGGPNKASEVLLWTIYQEGFVFLRIGPASAMAVAFVAVLLVLLVIQTRVMDRRVHYG